MHSLPFTPMAQCHCTRSHAFLEDMLWDMYVDLNVYPEGNTNISVCQTSQLPENDRHSVSYKEYLAEIDVSMGGRVAEELSECDAA